MADQVVLLFVGFILTTVLGGTLGYVFQRRAWTHQFNIQRAATERSAASSALDELSSLLDKRRYRMLRVYWQLDSGEPKELDRRVAAYQTVLEEWNDGLNRRLALVATHFGSGLKGELEGLYETYRRAGQLLDAAVRAVRRGHSAEQLETLVGLLDGLNQRNYRFSEAGLSLIISGRVGSNMDAGQREFAPTPPPSGL